MLAGVAALTAALIIFQTTERVPSSKIGATEPPAAQSSLTAPAKPLAGIARVVDGDTIVIRGAYIRLNGIDAPETKQSCEANGRAYPCGQQATEALIAFLAGRPTECTEVTKDRYQRIVARCQAESIDVGNWMVEHGWAIAYRKYSTEYVEAEQRAHIQKIGIWAGTFVQPEEWRRVKSTEKTHVE